MSNWAVQSNFKIWIVILSTRFTNTSDSTPQPRGCVPAPYSRGTWSENWNLLVAGKGSLDNLSLVHLSCDPVIETILGNACVACAMASSGIFLSKFPPSCISSDSDNSSKAILAIQATLASRSGQACRMMIRLEDIRPYDAFFLRSVHHFFPTKSLFPQTPLSFPHLSKYCSDKNPDLS